MVQVTRPPNGTWNFQKSKNNCLPYCALDWATVSVSSNAAKIGILIEENIFMYRSVKNNIISSISLSNPNKNNLAN
jgi:hypothetical protein